MGKAFGKINSGLTIKADDLANAAEVAGKGVGVVVQGKPLKETAGEKQQRLDQMAVTGEDLKNALQMWMASVPSQQDLGNAA